MQKIFDLALNLFGGSTALAVILGVLFLAVGFVCLAKGSDWFVSGAVGIASRFGIPQIVIGLTIVAMGTSSPEAAVSITGAFNNAADTSIGNILGSNILNILVILGLSAVICPLTVDKSTILVDTPFLLGITILLAVLGFDGKITLVDGLILFAIFIAYMTYLLIVALKNKGNQDEQVSTKPLWLTLILTALGLGIVILGSQLAVTGATAVAGAVGISERVIGLTIVALGTSLPELFTSVAAARKGSTDIAIGNIVGSNIFNILFVLALSGIITTVPFAHAFLIDTAVAVVSAILLFIFCATKRTLTRAEGAILLCGYLGYFVYLILN